MKNILVTFYLHSINIYKKSKKTDIAFFITSVLLSFFLFAVSYSVEHKSLMNEQRQNTKQLASIIEKEILINTEVLNVIKSVFQVKPLLSVSEFKYLMQPLLEAHPSIQALEWIPQVHHKQRKVYEKRMQKTFPNFTFKEKTNGKMHLAEEKIIYYPVLYVEPFLGNEAALGYDLGSSSIRLRTLQKAIDTKQTLATAKITLVQSQTSQAGFLVFSPIYTQENFRGFALGVFKIKDIIEVALREHNFSSYKITDQNDELLVGKDNAQFSHAESIRVLDRKWHLRVTYQGALLNDYPISIMLSLFILFMHFFLLYVHIQKQKEYTQLIDYNKDLQTKIQEAVTSVQEKDVLMLHQSRLAQMGELLSMIAHQWRQPLAYISSLSIGIILKIPENPDISSQQKNFNTFLKNKLGLIEKSVLNLSQTIDDFRNFYTSDTTMTLTSYKDIIENSLSIIQDSLNSNNINIIYNYKDVQKLTLAENEIMHVVLNIVKNAEDHFKQYPIPNPTITLTVNKNTLRISDNGKGIPAEIIEEVFNPYFSTKQEKNGTGLGLYMSKIIIEKHHNGILTAKANTHGSEFIITIPDLP